jgi:hypothetical protein
VVEMATITVPATRGLVPPVLPEIDETAARRALRDQIASLEAQLADVVVSNRLPGRVDSPAGGRRGAPRLLPLAELEQVRDRLADAVGAVGRAADARGAVEEANRRLREHLFLEPERHPYVRVTNADVGEPGCRDWHVRPRFGLLGMLMRWWRVHISSGCP